jgi:CRISPR-associated protein Csd1
LGFSPNAARLSVRLWLEDNFGVFADRLAEHRRDTEIDPPPPQWESPTIQTLLLETAVQHNYENIPPQLAGQLLRSILAGGRYPATLLATLLMRLRSDGEIRALRVAMLKAMVVRDRRLSRLAESRQLTREDRFVSYDPDCREPGYLLGQLFAVYEYAQRAALGGNIGATVKDKFYGSASTTPESVFPLLDRGSVPHIAKLRKTRPGQAVNIEKEIGEIMERLAPAPTTFPKSLPPAQQALFALGYYHQRNRRFATKPEADVKEEEAA